ncbi:3-isopropylmalate dehydratase small subunit [Floricoccus penangensis]|uniref:3-isopropylmalate dehydratase small subunit n=1 Tax=Floricoccus penangensis TaxID=1859475 RepID=A0A9Q5JI19_9LACT|nr:3-isopropylmalate dehydratase small subunit [Floricoccus penangensis]OFI47558.1 3-isopropylmalate dehydratase small subunit [Floricoccus penangensis]
MEKFTVYEGTTVPLMNDNIDTDQIIPKQFLKATDKIGFGKNMFFEWRYLENGKEENPDFVLNKPQYRGATILISGDNFGSGSSREHAAWAIKDYGFKVIIAGSYSDIFYNNALKNGLLPIVLAEDSREELTNLLPEQEIIVNLPNQTIETPEKSYSFDIDAEWKRKLVNGLDDIGLTMEFDDSISRYEGNRPSYLREVGI